MSDKDLIDRVINANRELVNRDLVKLTFGNASAISNDRTHVIIKPSGIDYKDLSLHNISNVDLGGKCISGGKPSVDTPTHIEIYKAFGEVSGIVHTHSHYATVFAQAVMQIPCLGTTHADYFYGNIPMIESLKKEEIEQDYERNTGVAIVRHFQNNALNPMEKPAVLVPRHGVFTWGKTVEEAVEHAEVLEEVAKLAYHTMILNRAEGIIDPISEHLLKKHFSRKHGKNKYYGQEEK